ncbi:MAG: ABC transporter permease [Chitinophagaceae bacterium]
MFRNYFTTALRNLKRNKRYSFIIILCLTVGLTACLLVATIVINDLSYDRQWTKSKEIYRILMVNKNQEGAKEISTSFSGLGPTMQQQFPEVKNYCRMQTHEERLRLGKDKDGIKIKCLRADTTLWHFLDFKILSGDPLHFVSGYTNIVLTATVAKEYFRNTNPVGKIIEDIPLNGPNKKYFVTGIIQDMPSNTIMNAKALLIHEPYSEENILRKDGAATSTKQFILLQPQTNITKFTQTINQWYENFMGKNFLNHFSFAFQPISDIHLYPERAGDTDTSGGIRNVYIFSGVALLLLLVACINFINLSTARMMKRVKESGIRKVLGAGKKQLMIQSLFESLLFFVISFGLSIIFYSIFLHGVEKFIGHSIAMSMTNHIGLLVICGGVILLVSVFTGIYPALLMARPKAITIVRGNLFQNTNSAFLRKVLITGQFVLAIALIIAMIVVRDQLYYLNNKDLGYNKENLLRVDFNGWGDQGKAFKQEVLSLHGVKDVSISTWSPASGGGYMTREVPDPADTSHKIQVWYISADVDFAKTMGLHLEKGRWFNPAFPTDLFDQDSLMQLGFDVLGKAEKAEHFLMTAHTAKKLGINKLNVPAEKIPGIPVGVIQNFNNESLLESLKPTVITADGNPKYGYMLVRVTPNSTQGVLKGIQKLWDEFYPQRVLQFDWVDDLLAKQYASEKKLSQLFTLFSSLSIFLACLGLFGLIVFTTERRTKEIGIRKVLGASVNGIVALLSKEFIVLVLIGFVIASPIAWWIMNKWLQNFAYRIHISWWIFLLAGVLAILIAFITVSFQAIKAAVANPVDSLRTE